MTSPDLYAARARIRAAILVHHDNPTTENFLAITRAFDELSAVDGSSSEWGAA